MNLDIASNRYALLYDMYARFQQAYYGKENEPALNKASFIAHMPLIVIDCSKQNETLKNAPVDVKVELQSTANFATNTSVYYLLLHELWNTIRLLETLGILCRGQ